MFAATNYNSVRQRRFFGGVSNSIINNDDNKTKSLSTRRITDSDTSLSSSTMAAPLITLEARQLLMRLSKMKRS